MLEMNLNKAWTLKHEGLECGPEMSAYVQGKTSDWMEVNLPCDVHTPLLERGIIQEPLEADNCYCSEWIEDKSWWFKKIFAVQEDILSSDVVELTLESLDSEADIFLNGVHLAHHKSAFYPFSADVKKYLYKGENTLLVRVTSGLEYVTENDLSGIKGAIATEYDGGRGDRGDKRRVFVRKPQYVYGWDWGPRVATCGIMKDVYLRWHNKIEIRAVHVITRSIDKAAMLDFEIEIENFHPYATREGAVNVVVFYNEEKVSQTTQEILFKSGINYLEGKMEINVPRLWWPNGMGDQPLYTVQVMANCEGYTTQYPDFKFGIKTLQLNMDKLNEKERQFIFLINGVKVYCKGGNWIPADSIYGRIPDETYTTLINEAKEANFNMLRIWGGGIYEKDIFYHLCDEKGIMVWHDFMFACAVYPDNREWFRNEVEKEMDYQTRRLRNHVSMVMWCGSNENDQGFDEWWLGPKKPSFFGGAACYNQIAPKIVHKNCPEIPYWNCSPYGGEHPNGSEVGDRHHWGDCMMNADIEKRITPEEYDKVTAKFVSEYGYPGPCVKSTIERYHGNTPIDVGSRIWQLHNNTFEKNTVPAGIAKHYAEVENLSLEEYLLYASLCQGLMLGYSLEAMRFKENCWGSIFWMYNDCWGEIGWTIIDYYLKRKPSFYYVKRAFAPIKFILRQNAESVELVGANETKEDVVIEIEYGFVTFDGKDKDCQTTQLLLKAFSKNKVFTFKKDAKLQGGIYYVKPAAMGVPIQAAVLREGTFRQLELPAGKPFVSNVQFENSSVKFTVSSTSYAHAVHFNLGENVHLSDEYFDLLPGETCEITATGQLQGLGKDDFAPVCL